MGLANITCSHNYALLGQIIVDYLVSTILTGDIVSLCFAKILRIQSFMDRFFSFLSRNKSVLSFKSRSRTGKTEDFSSPEPEI